VLNAFQEYGMDRKALNKLADVTHNVRDIGATIASGSFITAGMVIAPCSMKTLAGVAHAFADNLITRAADVILKERRRLVLITRETPLNLAHIRNMEMVTLMGGVIFPPVPAFYSGGKSVDDLVNHSVGRVLDLFDVEHNSIPRWAGVTGPPMHRKRKRAMKHRLTPRNLPRFPGSPAHRKRTRRHQTAGGQPAYRHAGRPGRQGAAVPQCHRLQDAGGLGHHPFAETRDHVDGLRNLPGNRIPAGAWH
jgi:polyprenyl P-hydroxybenzoate/phenylacrylic acid decarboxylase-like protein